MPGKLIGFKVETDKGTGFRRAPRSIVRDSARATRRPVRRRQRKAIARIIRAGKKYGMNA